MNKFFILVSTQVFTSGNGRGCLKGGSKGRGRGKDRRRERLREGGEGEGEGMGREGEKEGEGYGTLGDDKEIVAGVEDIEAEIEVEVESLFSSCVSFNDENALLRSSLVGDALK